MTREEFIAKKPELDAKIAEARAKAEAACIAYNDAFIAGEIGKLEEIGKSINEAVGEFNDSSELRSFAVCLDSDDPMKTACLELRYGTIRVKDEKVGEESDLTRKVIDDGDKPIDLLKLHKFVQERGINAEGIGADKKWPYVVEQFNCQLTARVAASLGISVKDISDSYAMSSIAKEISLGKTPTSNTNLLKTLNYVVSTMIGEDFKGNSHDVAFLIEGYSKKSRKALTLSTANHKTLRATMAEICHRILTNKGYSVEYKTNTKD